MTPHIYLGESLEILRFVDMHTSSASQSLCLDFKIRNNIWLFRQKRAIANKLWCFHFVKCLSWLSAFELTDALLRSYCKWHRLNIYIYPKAAYPLIKEIRKCSQTKSQSFFFFFFFFSQIISWNKGLSVLWKFYRSGHHFLKCQLQQKDTRAFHSLASKIQGTCLRVRCHHCDNHIQFDFHHQHKTRLCKSVTHLSCHHRRLCLHRYILLHTNMSDLLDVVNRLWIHSKLKIH